MRFMVMLVACSVLCGTFATTAVVAEPRLALLIGNQGYADKVGPLKNPHNDIGLVGKALESLGFKVTYLRDADFATMSKAIKKHAGQVRTAGKGTVDFVYYSGHGAADATTQRNFVIPIDVKDADTVDLWENSIDLKKDVVDELATQAPNAVHYVVFDACRNELQLKANGNKALGAGDKGFLPVADTSGLLIAYATAPSKTASDVGDSAGPYARALAEELVKPGIEAVMMFRSVQLRVKKEVEQDPWLSFPTLPAVYLAGEKGPETISSASLRIEDTQDPVELAAFVRQLPQGAYREAVEQKLEELRATRQLASIKYNCAGGRAWPPQNLSIGAQPVLVSAVPGIVALRLHSQAARTSLVFFTGTLIAPDWVLTAGHLADDDEKNNNFKLERPFQDAKGQTLLGRLEVIVGVDDLSSPMEDHAVPVEKVVVHPSFGVATKGADIALVKLTKPWPGNTMALSPNEAFDPPAFDASRPDGRAMVSISGYGFSAAQGVGGTVQVFKIPDGSMVFAPHHHLRQITLPIVEQSSCKRRYPNDNINESTICYGFETGGADGCAGFSGAPLVSITSEGCPYQVGLVSWGWGCGGKGDYGVNTRVSAYANWIRSIVPNANFLDPAKVTSSVLPLPNAWRALLGARPMTVEEERLSMRRFREMGSVEKKD